MIGRIGDIEGTGDPVSVAQTNFEILDLEGQKIVATYQSGVPNTVNGPPTSGTFVLDQLWKDALGGWWRCTVAGTPGTWRQEKAAIVASEPSSGTIPADYLIEDASASFQRKVHTGLNTYKWRPVNPPLSYFSLTGLTGGIAGKLDFVATTMLDVGITLGVAISGVMYFYQLTAGTQAESSPTYIRPDDYAASTNEKYWTLLS